MARATSGRFVLTGRIEFLEPFLVGGLEPAAGLDVIPFIDGAGRVVLPGTSVAGVLRSWCESNLRHWSESNGIDTDRVAAPHSVFGRSPRKGESDSDAAASRLRIDDVVIEDVNHVTLDSVGIDRFTGAAAKGVKLDRTVVAAGAHGHMRIVCECPGGEQPTAESPTGLLMAMIAGGLGSGTLRAGSGTTKGFGAFKVTSTAGDGLPGVVLQRTTRAGILDRLKDATSGEKVAFASSLTTQTRTSLTVSFQTVTPTFSKASLSGTVVDIIPRVDTKGNEAHLVIPATSMRGVIRSEAERIMRTLTGTRVIAGQPHHEQVRIALVDELFGIAPRPKVGQASVDRTTSEDHLGKAMTTMENLQSLLCSSREWASILGVATRPKSDNKNENDKNELALRKALDAVKSRVLCHTHHVAIDRWTGGAADKMLYSVLEPHVEIWQEWRVSLDDSRLGDKVLPGLALLLCVLQSLHEGSAGLGWGTHRGHGSVAISSLTVTTDGRSVTIEPNGNSLWAALTKVDPAWLESLRGAWADYLGTLGVGQ